MPVVSQASRLLARACQEALHNHRWNCSSVPLAPHFAPDLARGTREQAFVCSLGAASVAVAVGRACAEGRLTVCGCGLPNRDPPPDDFAWGGCADNVIYGVRAAKALLSEPFERRKFRQNTELRVHRHNSRVGWRAVRSSWRVQCKCHGVSGSCEAKTCWRALPPLQEVTRRLKLKYRDAEEVGLRIAVGRRTKVLPLQSGARFNKDDLVFAVKSPDYCVEDPAAGSQGTMGRECNDSSARSEGCEAMCCGRGHLTTWSEEPERCRCKYHWCCYVTCDQCIRRTPKHICL